MKLLEPPNSREIDTQRNAQMLPGATKVQPPPVTASLAVRLPRHPYPLHGPLPYPGAPPVRGPATSGAAKRRLGPIPAGNPPSCLDTSSIRIKSRRAK